MEMTKMMIIAITSERDAVLERPEFLDALKEHLGSEAVTASSMSMHCRADRCWMQSRSSSLAG